MTSCATQLHIRPYLNNKMWTVASKKAAGFIHAATNPVSPRCMMDDCI